MLSSLQPDLLSHSPLHLGFLAAASRVLSLIVGTPSQIALSPPYGNEMCIGNFEQLRVYYPDMCDKTRYRQCSYGH